ncbi:MAG: VOC family protein [Leptospiraceae bacterium]|nr:VOC family protein [Leptospiraceae bacterium]MDW8307214.1 VOC family protein [Leptospiraceae bacterium]
MIVVETLAHINIPAVDIKKSLDFYTLFLDFEEVEQSQDEAVVSFNSVNLRLYRNDKWKPAAYPVLSFILDVDDFTEALQEIESREIPIVTGPFEIEGGESVYIQDPAGNLIELFYQE